MVSGFPVKRFIFGENFVGSPLFDLFGVRRDDVDSLEDTDADFNFFVKRMLILLMRVFGLFFQYFNCTFLLFASFFGNMYLFPWLAKDPMW